MLTLMKVRNRVGAELSEFHVELVVEFWINDVEDLAPDILDVFCDPVVLLRLNSR